MKTKMILVALVAIALGSVGCATYGQREEVQPIMEIGGSFNWKINPIFQYPAYYGGPYREGYVRPGQQRVVVQEECRCGKSPIRTPGSQRDVEVINE